MPDVYVYFCSSSPPLFLLYISVRQLVSISISLHFCKAGRRGLCEVILALVVSHDIVIIRIIEQMFVIYKQIMFLLFIEYAMRRDTAAPAFEEVPFRGKPLESA
jgi:hypothetical protein